MQTFRRFVSAVWIRVVHEDATSASSHSSHNLSALWQTLVQKLCLCRARLTQPHSAALLNPSLPRATCSSESNFKFLSRNTENTAHNHTYNDPTNSFHSHGGLLSPRTRPGALDDAVQHAHVSVRPARAVAARLVYPLLHIGEAERAQRRPPAARPGEHREQVGSAANTDTRRPYTFPPAPHCSPICTYDSVSLRASAVLLGTSASRQMRASTLLGSLSFAPPPPPPPPPPVPPSSASSTRASCPVTVHGHVRVSVLREGAHERELVARFGLLLDFEHVVLGRVDVVGEETRGIGGVERADGDLGRVLEAQVLTAEVSREEVAARARVRGGDQEARAHSRPPRTRNTRPAVLALAWFAATFSMLGNTAASCGGKLTATRVTFSRLRSSQKPWCTEPHATSTPCAPSSASSLLWLSARARACSHGAWGSCGAWHSALSDTGPVRCSASGASAPLSWYSAFTAPTYTRRDLASTAKLFVSLGDENAWRTRSAPAARVRLAAASSSSSSAAGREGQATAARGTLAAVLDIIIPSELACAARSSARARASREVSSRRVRAGGEEKEAVGFLPDSSERNDGRRSRALPLQSSARESRGRAARREGPPRPPACPVRARTCCFKPTDQPFHRHHLQDPHRAGIIWVVH
ncbi:hypothetical protein SRHO_G00332650 [Serrasalmus rhombeus]